MNFHILTLFPEMVLNGLDTSIIGRAEEKGLIHVEARNIRDYTNDRHKKVDDYPYGGGAGMLMQAQPVYDCWKAVRDEIVSRGSGNTAAEADEIKSGDSTSESAGSGNSSSGRRIRTVYLTPQGRTFTQKDAHDFAREEDLILLCGHYEGIDDRVLDRICTDYISIGDYVLTGGELPAMILVDAVSRLVPGVLHNDTSAETESFESGILEYPQYSRPEVWEGEKVPEVLLSGDHKKVDEWRRVRAILRTYERRPDLLKNLHFKKADRKLLKRVEMTAEEKKIFEKLLQDHMDSDRI
ncbi:MAG: tRNA (guanosine(37)-N1)-methyltransferase TrmD [Lachnospiraceae bacterium]|nr:tRNA (guanosine(37)-N1)-methyltransferase TrmD [Lachnospiraceae bacterium]